MKKVLVRACLCLLVLSLIIPAGGFAQNAETAPPIFRQEELDQMLAPIALYPDSLLVQVLMAATYPLEVVQAARWVSANPNLRADDMANILDKKIWDPSVKSLVNFPSILTMMSDKLEWTQDIGDAFLGQKEQVMNTVQDLRAKAYTLGNLATTYEQVVVVEEDTIVIEPASPQIIYVPIYNPTVVYGPWWYPAYPPYYYHPPGYAVARAGVISFGVGLTAGVAWGYAWGNVNWDRNQVYVHPTRIVTINNFHTGHGSGEWRHDPSHRNELSVWRHDPGHRKGVAYRDPGLRQQFGQTGNPGADPRKDFRGVDQGGTNRPGNPVNHTGGTDRPVNPVNHPGITDRPVNPVNHPDVTDRPVNPVNHPGVTDRPVNPVNRPGSEQRQDVGIIHNRQPSEQNRPSGGIESINPGGSTVKQQSGRPSQNVPAQKPVQTIQGDKIGQTGVGGVPNTSGGDGRPGSGGVIPPGTGGGVPNIGGAGHGGLPGSGGQDGFRRQQ
jgi:Protein of unknown function (DUF3300)